MHGRRTTPPRRSPPPAVRARALSALLGPRRPSPPGAAVHALVAGQTVMVTGAGGSIGAELCRQLARLQPRRLVLVEQAEHALFTLEAAMARVPGPPRRPYIANVCDPRRMRAIFQQERPNLVLHAAAHKHVPLMEHNPGEAVKNNALGTRCVADLAVACGVGHFVLLSTDKAVNPSSVMGASKRLAERYVQALAARAKTRLCAVRFGNVMGSQGSVVPLFEDQIARGGPVTVTDRRMQRYFMTLDQACLLTLEAAAMAQRGALYLFDMGPPVHIVELAQALIDRAGRAVAVAEVGPRPGEKLAEELHTCSERVVATAHPQIAMGQGEQPPWQEVAAAMDELDQVSAQVLSVPQFQAVLARLVPEYRPAVTPPGEGEPRLDVVRPVPMFR